MLLPCKAGARGGTGLRCHTAQGAELSLRSCRRTAGPAGPPPAGAAQTWISFEGHSIPYTESSLLWIPRSSANATAQLGSSLHILIESTLRRGAGFIQQGRSDGNSDPTQLWGYFTERGLNDSGSFLLHGFSSRSDIRGQQLPTLPRLS